MTTCFLAPDPVQSTFLIPGGNTPGNGAQVFFYVAGSNTKQTVYKDNAANVAWTNPIVLDSGGNLPSGGSVWFPTGQTFKVVWAPANDSDPPASPYRTMDTLSGVNDVSANTASEWITGPTPTFTGTTTFTVIGDQRNTFTQGRRLRTTNTGGTVYSTVVSSVFGAVTTVTVVNDSGVLDAGLSAVSYGILDPSNSSIDYYHVQRKGASVASAGSGTTNIWGINGDYVHITGTNAIYAFSTASYAGAEKTVIFDGVLTLNSSAALQIPGPASFSTTANDAMIVRADTVTSAIVVAYTKANGAAVFAQMITTSLTADVNLNNAANYFDGPTIAQGSTTGTWFATGTVTLQETQQGNMQAKLWDGTTVFASAQTTASSSQPQSTALSLSGYITNPAGNIRISVKDASSVNGLMRFNISGNSKDCTLTVIRIL